MSDSVLLSPPHWTDVSAWCYFSGTEAASVVLGAIAMTALRSMTGKGARSLAVKLNVKPAEKQRKFAESCWKATYYTLAFCVGSYVLFAREWVSDLRLLWVDVLSELAKPMQHFDIQLFYLTQLSFYVHSIFTHVFLDTRRLDFWQMLIHHVATTLLVFFSYASRTYGIGTVILVLHDTSDVLFEIAKLFVYLDWEFAANVFFGVWTLSWFVLRLVIFPKDLLRTAFFDSCQVMNGCPPLYQPLILLLLTLQVLHVVWFGMIIRMIVRLATGKAKKVEDTRETEMPVDEESKQKKT